MAATSNPIEDLEAALRPYASVPADTTWLPISLFTMQGKSVAVCIRPHSSARVTVTDDGETLSTLRDMGIEVEKGTALARDLAMLASKRGFQFDGHVFYREVSPDEIPTAALHLAEVEIAASGLLQSRYLAPFAQLFTARAKAIITDRLKPRVAKIVKFGAQYAGPYKDGEFFCVAETEKPIGVKIVTDTENMKDAVIAGMMYSQEPILLAALRKPRIKLGGPRVLQFATLYQNHMYETAEKLADFITERAAS